MMRWWMLVLSVMLVVAPLARGQDAGGDAGADRIKQAEARLEAEERERAATQPTAEEQIKGLKAQITNLRDQVIQLQGELEVVRLDAAELNHIRSENAVLKAENDDLKAALEAMRRATTQPQGSGSAGTIYGGVWVVHKDRSSDLMRGAKVYLVRAVVRKEPVIISLQRDIEFAQSELDINLKLVNAPSLSALEQAAAQKRVEEYSNEIAQEKKAIVSVPDQMDAKEAFEVLGPNAYGPDFERVAQDSAVATDVVDQDGRYRFEGVQPGGYYLFCRVSGDSYCLEWIAPVRAVGDSVKIDLFNDNAAYIRN